MKSVIWTILFSIIFISCQVDDGPHMASKERFREIAKLRDRGEINRACTMYQDIVETNYTADKLDIYESDVSEALTQAFNMYQNLGEPYQAVVWLDSLKRENNAMMNRCKPDLYALYGYALTRIDSIEKAKEMIDSAFVLFKDNLSPERKLKIYAYAAGAYFSQPEKSEDVINWCNLALECIPNKDAANRPFLLSMLAGVYQRNGQIDKALNVLNQSLEIARTGGDARSIANTLNTIAQLYEAWHLNQSAEIYTDLSLDEIENSVIKHPVITGEAYTLKGKLMFDRKDKDAIKFLNRADSICREMSYNMGSEDVDLVMGKYFMEMTDSVEKAKDRFHRITKQAIPPKRIEAYYLLAKLYNQEGKDDIADEMLDSMRVLLDQMPNVEPPIGALHWALKYYGMRGKVEEIQKLAQALSESHTEENMLETQRVLVENILAFNEQQNREKIEMMQLESKVRLHRWLLVAMIVALASLLLTALVMISRLKLKAEHIKLKNEQLQIAQDLAIEKAQSQDAKEHYVEVLGALSRTNVAHNITAENIKQNGEEWLQHRFSIAYPKFWQNIQERGINLGKREKLFLILLVIGLETHNIAEILGIEKRSVNINRYRLRQKFSLKSDESLEDYLHALVNQNENKNF